ncbi:MAG: FG-GAP-like repeat-containing protein, partial [Calditrichaceae bacterium]
DGEFYTFENNTIITKETFNKVDWTIPAGYMLNKSTDLDHDGKKEIIISRYDEENMFGPVEIYEFENGRFEKRAQTSFSAIPRDAGDADHDGLSDILLGYGDDAYILESTSEYNFPVKIVWVDTTEFWAAGYSDLDGDGLIELAGRKKGDYVLLESAGDNNFNEIGVLSNPTQGLNRYGVPLVLNNDVNGDHLNDLTFGDYDGDLITYSSMGDNNFVVLATGRTRFPDATEMLAAKDSVLSLADVFAATHTIDNLNYEHEFDARYWTLERFRYRDYDGKLVPRDTLNFYGYFSTRDYDSGISISYFDNRPCLFVSFFPNMYIFAIEEDGLQAIWHTSRSRSNSILIDDMDGDGNDEFYFNDGNNITGFTRASANRPAAPYPLRVQPLDSTRIRLWWGSAATAGNYAVYRGSRYDELTLLAYTSDAEFTDTGLESEKLYYYAVSAIDSVYIIPEGFLCDTDSAKTSYPPRLVKADVINERQLILTFNENVLVPDIRNYNIFTSQNYRIATSVLNIKDKKQLLVSFNEAFKDGQTDTVNVRNITDQDGVPVDEKYNFTQYIFDRKPEKPYLEQIEILDRYHLKLRFSVSMDRMQLMNRDNYELVPSGEVTDALNTDKDGRIVELSLDRKSFAGSFGQPSYLILNNLKGENGVELDETGKINLLTEATLKDDFIVYPNPVRPYHDEIIFGGIPERAEIYIYSINGKLIRNINKLPDFGGISWDLKDTDGKRVATGVYIFIIKSAGYDKSGKIVIVR